MFIKCHLWENTHFEASGHPEGVKLGTAIMINLDTVSSMVDHGSSPAGVRITFKREEARDPVTVYGSIATLADLFKRGHVIPSLEFVNPPNK